VSFTIPNSKVISEAVDSVVVIVVVVVLVVDVVVIVVVVGHGSDCVVDQASVVV